MSCLNQDFQNSFAVSKQQGSRAQLAPTEKDRERQETPKQKHSRLQDGKRKRYRAQLAPTEVIRKTRVYGNPTERVYYF